MAASEAQNLVRMVDWEEVAEHKTKDSCWTVIKDKKDLHVWDLTSFLAENPSFAEEYPIEKYAGREGTSAFEGVSLLDLLDEDEAYIGVINKASKMTDDQKSEPPKQAEQPTGKPPLSSIVNVWDLEAVAHTQVGKEAWDYLNSGGDDEITLRENHVAFTRVWLRPFCLINVSQIDYSCEMLGTKSSFPIYITGTALGRLYHEDGEMCLTKAAASKGIIQMCPTLASCTMDEMLSVKDPAQTQWWQLYVNADRELTKKVVKKAEAAGMKGLFITVDAPQLGRRERDMRNKAEQQADVQGEQKEEVQKNQGTTRAISSFIDPSLNWDDIEWFKSITNMPIVLKGIQRADDAIKAVEYGVAGIVCSNHGGRQIDTSRSGLEILEDVMNALEERGLQDKLEVYVDGGIRRATDIFKCLALGAKGCGLGRPFLYGIGSYGVQGAEKVVDILMAEMEMCMRLMGTPKLSDIGRKHIITKNLADHMSVPLHASLPEASYEPLKPAITPSRM
jgi:L-lactate dehydrogenase (cytochrome)